MKAHQELFQLSDRLAAYASAGEREEIRAPLQALKNATQTVDRSFSGSWLGYHSRVYYADFAAPPPGAHFSQEWGLKSTFSGLGSRGDWREYPLEAVKDYVLSIANNPDLSLTRSTQEEIDDAFSSIKAEITSIFQIELARGPDTFLERLSSELQELAPLSVADVANHLHRKGEVITRDTIVLGQGSQVPPHIAIKAEVRSIEHSFAICRESSLIARKAASHIERKANVYATQERIGTTVFIGHGRSSVWRDLKDFIQDRIKLPWDEFNRIPVAGITNTARLLEMLDSAAIAFLVMTAEDELADGSMQARMNVIHEAGLFQGRLGFTKAIILLEDGCEEFSNIAGLGQIRFPKGKISAVFEEIRRVLEREELVSQ